jgi:hypothetical protein
MQGTRINAAGMPCPATTETCPGPMRRRRMRTAGETTSRSARSRGRSCHSLPVLGAPTPSGPQSRRVAALGMRLVPSIGQRPGYRRMLGPPSRPACARCLAGTIVSGCGARCHVARHRYTAAPTTDTARRSRGAEPAAAVRARVRRCLAEFSPSARLRALEERAA